LSFLSDLDGGIPDAGPRDGSVPDGSVIDTGPTVGGLTGGACGCRVAPREDSRALLLGLVGLALALAVRRRR
jgi:MYXO-CTERM domain-containing protein